MILPLIVSSSAALITLAYASILDVRDRSVPVSTWYPLYIAGSIAVLWYLVTAMVSRTTLAGYAALILTVIYGIELEAEKGKVPWRVLALALGATALQAIAWGQLLLVFGPLAACGFIPLLALLWFGLDLERKASLGEERLSLLQREARIWHIPAIIALQGAAWAALFLTGGSPGDLLLVLVALYSEIFLIFAVLNLFGGADAIALIAIALFVPRFPLDPLLGYPPIPFLPFSALTNAVLLNLVTPVGIAIGNALRRNRAPFPYTFFGFPVKGDTIQHEFGFVMEDFREEEGKLLRNFIPVRVALRRMVAGKGRIYTKHLKEQPERYAREIALYRRAGMVWISYGVPFILPIAAGFATALLGGDILFSIMKLTQGR